MFNALKMRYHQLGFYPFAYYMIYEPFGLCFSIHAVFNSTKVTFNIGMLCFTA